MARAITTIAELEALIVGSVVTLTTPNGKVVNAGVKTEPDNWALGGQVRKYTAEGLFKYAVKRDGFTVALLS